MNGFDTKQTVVTVTVTVREKGKTLQQTGGLVMTTGLWLAADAPSTKDLHDFDMRYAQKLYGPTVVGASAQVMAMAMAMYPQIQPALDKMRAEGGQIEGTAILTTITMDAVTPAQAAAEEAKPAASGARPRGLGGMLGGITKKMAKKDDDGKPATIMTTSVEMLKLTTSVDAASVALPAGFTEQK